MLLDFRNATNPAEQTTCVVNATRLKAIHTALLKASLTISPEGLALPHPKTASTSYVLSRLTTVRTSLKRYDREALQVVAHRLKY